MRTIGFPVPIVRMTRWKYEGGKASVGVLALLAHGLNNRYSRPGEICIRVVDEKERIIPP